jgi:hypothetical protein
VEPFTSTVHSPYATGTVVVVGATVVVVVGATVLVVVGTGVVL